MGGAFSGGQDRDRRISISSQTTTNTEFRNAQLVFPEDGVHLSFLDHFVEECGGENVLARLTTKQVAERFVKPLTWARKASYCSLLKQNYPAYISTANVYVVHAWKSVFLDVYHALKARGDVVLYLFACLFPMHFLR